MASTLSIDANAFPKRRLPNDLLALMEEAWRQQSSDTVIPPSNLQKILAEFIGTYILVFVGCASLLVNREMNLTIVGVAIAWSLALVASIYAVGHISGAHVNPAVTIAFAAARKFPLFHVPLYVLAQLLGSLLASLTLKLLFHHRHDILPTVNQFKPPITDLEAIAWEFIATFFLMFIICGTASDDRAHKGLAGMAIGAILISNILIAGPITGASMNPARSIGPAIVTGVYKNQWVYVVAPILGAIAAALIYGFLRAPNPGKPRKSIQSIHDDLELHSEA